MNRNTCKRRYLSGNIGLAGTFLPKKHDKIIKPMASQYHLAYCVCTVLTERAGGRLIGLVGRLAHPPAYRSLDILRACLMLLVIGRRSGPYWLRQPLPNHPPPIPISLVGEHIHKQIERSEKKSRHRATRLRTC